MYFCGPGVPCLVGAEVSSGVWLTAGQPRYVSSVFLAARDSEYILRASIIPVRSLAEERSLRDSQSGGIGVSFAVCHSMPHAVGQPSGEACVWQRCRRSYTIFNVRIYKELPKQREDGSCRKLQINIFFS